MEEAETIKPEDIQKEKIIETLLDKDKIIFRLKTKNDNLFITTEIKVNLISQIYEGIISQKEIQKNKYFLQFDTLDEILDELILKSKSESPKVSKENESLILKISLSSSKFKDIEFILKPKSKNTEDKFKELYKMVTELKKENINLKQRLNKLEDENSQIKEQMKILIDFKNEIKKEKEKENDKKNLKMDSNILNDDQDKKNKIKEFICHNKKVSAELKYRLTKDGADFNTFHKLCDNISPNLLLIKDDKDNIFGGYTKVTWEKRQCEKIDPECFLFSLNKNKKYCPKHNDYTHIYCYSKYGPWFWGGDIGFQGKNMSLCISCGTGDFLDESLSTNNAGNYFNVKEVEFYKINLENY